MAKQTNHIGLTLFEDEDAVDVSGLSKNYQLIDDEVGRLRQEDERKANRAPNPTAGHLAALDGAGNLVDCGKALNQLAIAGHTHTADQINGLPSSLPANGGNADTVDGYHAEQLTRYIWLLTAETANINNTQTPYIGDIANGEEIGLEPCWWHILYLPHINTNGYGAQIAIPLNDPNYLPKYRMAANGAWGEWKRFADGGNAATAVWAGGNQAEGEAQLRNMIVYPEGTDLSTIPIPAAGTIVAIKK